MRGSGELGLCPHAPLVRVSLIPSEVTYGQEFFAGQTDTWTLKDWPTAGTDTRIRWTESLQNVEIFDILRR